MRKVGKWEGERTIVRWQRKRKTGRTTTERERANEREKNERDIRKVRTREDCAGRHWGEISTSGRDGESVRAAIRRVGEEVEKGRGRKRKRKRALERERDQVGDRGVRVSVSEIKGKVVIEMGREKESGREWKRRGQSLLLPGSHWCVYGQILLP